MYGLLVYEQFFAMYGIFQLISNVSVCTVFSVDVQYFGL